MRTSLAESVALALAVRFSADDLIVDLSDGRIISVPLAWFPRLLHASAAQKKKWEIIGDGVGVHWPLIDEDLSIAGLLRGTAAPTDSPASRVHYGLQRTEPRRTRKQSR